jgi:hypothetical protein
LCEPDSGQKQQSKQTCHGSIQTSADPAFQRSSAQVLQKVITRKAKHPHGCPPAAGGPGGKPGRRDRFERKAKAAEDKVDQMKEVQCRRGGKMVHAGALPYPSNVTAS